MNRLSSSISAHRAVAAASAAVFLLAGCEAEAGDDTPQAGTSIEVAAAHADVEVVPRDLEFTDARELLEITGSEEIEIVDVQITSDADLVFLGASVAFPEEESRFRSLTSYPPRKSALGRIEPAVGLTLEPLSSGDIPPVLLIGLKVKHSGVFERTEIVVDYQESGKTYRVVLPARLSVCTDDTAMTLAICEGIVEG